MNECGFRCTGYGDIHPVNLREMIFVMFYVSFDMVLGAYLIGNITALIVKGSKTERYRDRMKDLLKYIDRNGLGRNISNEIKNHLRLQYDSNYEDSSIIQNLPSSIRAKVWKKRIMFIIMMSIMSSILNNVMIISCRYQKLYISRTLKRFLFLGDALWNSSIIL